MSRKALLTIAIPTYNREYYLNLCLERVFQEVGSLGSDQAGLVDILVSDNASTDGTSKIILRYQENFKGSFQVIFNNENMGMGFNFAQCYRLPRTPYIWILGDDDVLLPGGLVKILDVLLNNEIDLLYLNNYWFKNTYMERPNWKRHKGTSILNNALKFTCKTNVMLTYLSGLVVRSGAGYSYRREFSGSSLIQLSWVLPLLRDGKCFAIIDDWVVAAKSANSSGYSLVDVFAIDLQKISMTILKDRPELARVIESGTIVNFFPPFITQFRMGESRFDDKTMSDGLKKVFGKNWRYYVFIAPLLTLPIPLMYSYSFFLKTLRGGRRFFRDLLWSSLKI